MKFRKLTSEKNLVILLTSILITGCLFFISQRYFSYTETKNLVDECYDKGGFPEIEKSGLSIEYFSCNMS